MAEKASEYLSGVAQRLKDKAAQVMKEHLAGAPPVEGEPVYKSSLPFADDRPECLVITCGDSRYLPHTLLFVEEGLKVSRWQLMAVPGGVQWLALPDVLPKHEKVARWAVEAMVESKNIKRIICVAHSGCGAYTDSNALSTLAHLATGKTIAEHQIEQLRKVGRSLTAEFQCLVELYFASVADGAVSYRKVEFADTGSAKP